MENQSLAEGLPPAERRVNASLCRDLWNQSRHQNTNGSISTQAWMELKPPPPIKEFCHKICRLNGQNGGSSKGFVGGGQLDPARVTSIGLNVTGMVINMVFRCKTFC